MSRRRPIGRKLFRSLLPIVLLLALALVGVSGWIVYRVTRPPSRAYLVTPQTYSQLSGPVLKVSEETWRNRDGTQARGWLLRGAEGAPAVVLLHRYGGDRSWVLNLGVKLNEAANFTILWPDLRGHGLNPTVKWTSFGAREGDDTLDAIAYLKGLKSASGQALVANRVGLYGVELGAYAALRAAQRDELVRVLVLDSTPSAADDVVRASIKDHLGISAHAIQFFGLAGVRVYFLGGYDNTPSCALAGSLRNQKVLLLSGNDAGELRNGTIALQRCFPNAANVEVNSDLPLTGLDLPWAPGEQGEGYDRRVIEFFDKNLRAAP
jgi:pimeloyl-ACP methyl ester carboxylesterase